MLLISIVAMSALAHAEPASTNSTPISLSVAYPATTFARKAPVVKGVSLNLFDGLHREMYGLEIGVLLNRASARMDGLQIAGLANATLGEARGVQLAGGVNIVRHPSSGLQVSGVFNYAASIYTPDENGFRGVQLSAGGNFADLIAGVQIAGGINIAVRLAGAQAGFLNLIPGQGDGLQIGFINMQRPHMVASEEIEDRPAGTPEIFALALGRTPFSSKSSPFASLADDRSHLVQIGLVNMGVNVVGAQLALMLNIDFRARGLLFGPMTNFVLQTVHGAELSFLFNFAGGFVEGLQLSLINICGSLRGVQLGIVNICGRVVGLQIGVLNIAYLNTVPFLPGLNIGF